MSDHLTELVMTIHSLKKFTPSTKSQSTILKNIIKVENHVMFDFYLTQITVVCKKMFYEY